MDHGNSVKDCSAPMIGKVRIGDAEYGIARITISAEKDGVEIHKSVIDPAPNRE